ncbi:hypothetical protein AB0J38_14510 [Streptomyces sp. NPDC050095]|uniref:hypothetical protein n=1 Tax=unclassified Streptomyces TaxID=2593676 RepID=UPI00343D7CE4
MSAHENSKTPWWEETEPITLKEIAERLQLKAPTATAWSIQGTFGRPVGTTEGRGRAHVYSPRLVYLGGRRKGILGEDGTVVKKVSRGSHSGYPEGQKVDVDGVALLSVPQMAAKFGVQISTINQWTKRRTMRGNPDDIPVEDLREAGFVYWREDTANRWGVATERLDPKTLKPTPRTGSRRTRQE